MAMCHTCQEAMLPCDIVGDNAGMDSSCGMKHLQLSTATAF